jgi:hypothetical protein
MNLAEFEESLHADRPPESLPGLLRALWHDAKGDWNAAHAGVQEEDSADAAWVHAYLHRKEGDLGNAGYWYRRAGRPPARGSPADEWKAITAALVERG